VDLIRPYVLRGKGAWVQAPAASPCRPDARYHLGGETSPRAGASKDPGRGRSHMLEPRRRLPLLDQRYIERAENCRGFLEVSEAMALDCPPGSAEPWLALIPMPADDRELFERSSVRRALPQRRGWAF